jgi:hypothetical protein
VVFGEAAQHDVHRALPILDVGVADVREHAPPGGLLDEVGIARVKEDDHGAGGFDVGALASGHGAHVCDVDLSRDHLVARRDHDRRDESQAILALVGDQDAQMLGSRALIQRLQPTRVSMGQALGRR